MGPQHWGIGGYSYLVTADYGAEFATKRASSIENKELCRCFYKGIKSKTLSFPSTPTGAYSGV